jgi:hypothetical protein
MRLTASCKYGLRTTPFGTVGRRRHQMSGQRQARIVERPFAKSLRLPPVAHLHQKHVPGRYAKESADVPTGRQNAVVRGSGSGLRSYERVERKLRNAQ